MKKALFILMLVTLLLIGSVSAVYQCTAPLTTGCSSSSNLFTYYGYCTNPVGQVGATCGNILAVNNYVLTVTKDYHFTWWSSSNNNGAWYDMAVPHACGGKLAGGDMSSGYSSANLVGVAKTTRPDMPFVLLYAKWNPTKYNTFKGANGIWDFAVVSWRTSGTASDQCSHWYKNYEGVADFIQSSHLSFACITEGNGPNGASSDQECFFGGTRPSGVFDFWGIADGWGGYAKDPGDFDCYTGGASCRRKLVYEVKATDRLFAVSGPDNWVYGPGPLYLWLYNGTASGKIWWASAFNSGGAGVKTWTDMTDGGYVNPSGRIQNNYGDGYSSPPRFFEIDKWPSNTYQFAGYGMNAKESIPGGLANWVPYQISDAVQFSTGSGKFVSGQQISLANIVYGTSAGPNSLTGVSGQKGWGVPTASPGMRMGYISNNYWGSTNGWTYESCLGPSTDVAARGAVDWSPNGVGWAIRSTTNKGCMIYSTLHSVYVPACECGSPARLTNLTCGGACGPFGLTCSPQYACYYEDCTPLGCGNSSQWTCQYDPTVCGNKSVTCRTGAGSGGIWGYNWWTTAYIGSEYLGSTCGSDSSPYPTYNVNWGSPMTITTNSFHYKGYAAQVTVYVDKYDPLVCQGNASCYASLGGNFHPIWQNTHYISNTNVLTGIPSLWTWSTQSDWTASPFCKQGIYNVYVRTVFLTSGEITNSFITNTFRLNINAANTNAPNGALCQSCTCGDWTTGDCTVNASINNICTVSKPFYQTRYCINGCSPGDGFTDNRCWTDAQCTTAVNCTSIPIYDCGSNGCGESQISVARTCYNALNDPVSFNYVCQDYSPCTEAGSCSAWEAGTVCGAGGCLPDQVKWTRVCQMRPGDFGTLPFDTAYCGVSDAVNCTTPPNTGTYSANFMISPSTSIQEGQNGVLYTVEFTQQSNTTYYVGWSYRTCVEGDTVCYTGSDKNGSFQLFSGIGTTKSISNGAPPLAPGTYRVIFKTHVITTGTPFELNDNVTLTVTGSNFNITLNPVAGGNLGQDMPLDVVLVDSLSRPFTIGFDFYNANGTKIDEFVPINQYSPGAHTFNKTLDPAIFYPGSFSVQARATRGNLTMPSEVQYFTVVGVDNYEILLNVSNLNPLFGQDEVVFTVTPRDLVCSPSCRVASELSLFFMLPDSEGYYTVAADSIPPWKEVQSGQTKTFTIGPSFGNTTSSSSGWGFRSLQPGKSYLVVARATFSGNTPVASSLPQQWNIYAQVTTEQTGFTPLEVYPEGGGVAYVTYGTLTSSSTAPVSYICSLHNRYIINQWHPKCLVGKDVLGIDVISGITGVQSASEDIDPSSPVRAIVYTGYEIVGNKQIDKVGIIDYIDSLGNFVPSIPSFYEISHPGITGDEGCISNPVALHCPEEINVTVGIGIDAPINNSVPQHRGGTFAYIYYVNDDAYLRCDGADALIRLAKPGLSVSNWTTAGTTIPLYKGTCMTRGGLTAVDTDKDGYEEVIGGGGIINVKKKTVNYKFGENRAIIPADVNSDGYIDFVSQEYGVLEVWPGTSTYIQDYSNELGISAINPCEVDTTGELTAVVIPRGPGNPGDYEYRMNFGDGSEEYHPASWSGGANKFIGHPYRMKGDFIITATVIYGTQTANKTCVARVTTIPNFYNFSGRVSKTCSIGTDGLFTGFSGPLSKKGWIVTGSGTFKSAPNIGVLMTSDLPTEMYKSVKSTTATQVIKARFESVDGYTFDMAYRAKLEASNEIVDAAKIRVADPDGSGSRLYVVERGGNIRQLATVAEGEIYDVELEVDYETRSVNVNFGVQGSQLVNVYSDGYLLVSNNFDILNGEMKFSYFSGNGYLFIFDYACAGSPFVQNMSNSEIDRHFNEIGGFENLGLLSSCVGGQPPYFMYGPANGTVRNFFTDNMTNEHGVSENPYPNVGLFCRRLDSGECNYEDLKFITYRNPECYKEVHNYCVDVVYPRSTGQVGRTSDGALSCTTTLGIQNIYHRAASPTLQVVSNLISENWFELAIVIIFVLVAAAFAGNKKGR